MIQRVVGQKTMKVAKRTSRAAVITGIVLALAIATGCGAGPSKSEKTVRRFVSAMMRDDQATLRSMISPSWLRAAGINVEEYAVNALSPVSCEVESVRGPEVTVKLRHLAGATRLVLRVTDEEGQSYIEPGGIGSRGWIEPWVRMERLDE